MKRKINLDELRKVEATTVIPLANQGAELVQAIIKVKKPGYVPDRVHVRSAISPLIVTGEFKYGELASLEKDPNVESVSISKKLHSTE